MFKRSLLAATVLAVAATPALASAATLTVDKPCFSDGYVDGPKQKIGFTAGGFPADAFVQLNGGFDNSYIGDFTTTAGGGFEGEFDTPSLGSLKRMTFPLSAALSPNREVSASTTFTVADAAVSMSPPVARPTTKVSYKAQGFVGGKFLYAHYAYTKSPVSHPLVKTVKLGALTGPCGDLTTKKAKQLPLAKLKRKTVYEIQIDASPVFKRQQGNYITRTVFVP
ncbi:hypothetical protein DSM112329_01332 [Paraconexibacter sp. AEG42_29]|uniref:Uncharacterized protein n=1 Tax=Paraconexibacter sp. AEG42_29 TaxID=2997339 RepID=A0AAU7AS25_9ACTN